MSYTIDQILSFALNFEKITSESLVKSANKKEYKTVYEKSKSKQKEKKSFIEQFDFIISKQAQNVSDSDPVNWNIKEQTEEDAKAFLQKDINNKVVKNTNQLYYPDVAQAQRKLNDMIMRGTIQGKLLDTDGKLGNLTKEVLTTYKKYLGIPSLSDQEAIKALNTKKDEVKSGPSIQNKYDSGTLRSTGPNEIVRKFPE